MIEPGAYSNKKGIDLIANPFCFYIKSRLLVILRFSFWTTLSAVTSVTIFAGTAIT